MMSFSCSILGMMLSRSNLKDRDMLVFVSELASSSVVLGVRCWFRQEDFWKGKWRVTENCKLSLDENGIEIAYNQLDVHVDGKVQGLMQKKDLPSCEEMT